jgi:hypothetical protein
LNIFSHNQSVSPASLSNVVNLDTTALSKFDLRMQRLLLFAAYEARGVKSSVIGIAHLKLATLREQRPKDAHEAADIRCRCLAASADGTATVEFPLDVSEQVLDILNSSHSAQQVLHRLHSDYNEMKE